MITTLNEKGEGELFDSPSLFVVLKIFILNE